MVIATREIAGHGPAQAASPWVSNRLPNTTIGAGTVSVGGLYFGPPSALLFGTRSGFRWDVSDQVSWATYQADARMVGRFGYVVGVPTAWCKQLGIIV